MLQKSRSIKDLKTYLKMSEHISNKEDVITEDDMKRIKTDGCKLHDEVPVCVARGLKKRKTLVKKK